ncbi:MAG: hypothetical protein AAF432_11370 [Planctomycetota bacterium]
MIRISAILAVLLATTATLAQGRPGAPALETEPFRIDELGFSINLPQNALVTTERVGTKRTYAIRDTSPDPRWSMRIATLDATNADVTARDQIDAHLESLQRNQQAFRILSLEQRPVHDRLGQLVIVRRDVERGSPYIEGWLIAPRGSRSFLVISMLTLPEHLDTIQPLLLRSFDTIRMTSVLEQSATREARIQRGVEFLETITESDLRRHIGMNRWLRIYNSNDNSEIGFTHITVDEGPRGRLDGNARPDRYTAAESEVGLFVTVRARVIDASRKDAYIDLEGRYWLSWDAEEEAWSSLATARQHEATQTASETGTRTRPGVGPGKLTVIKAVNQVNTREQFDWTVPNAYLPQALSFVVGELMPRNITAPIEMHFYGYHPTGDDNKPRMALRTERWAPPGHGSRHWTLSTTVSGELEPHISHYDGNGELIRRTRPDGTVTEPIQLDQLRLLWERKGLRTGK